MSDKYIFLNGTQFIDESNFPSNPEMRLDCVMEEKTFK